MRPQVSSVSRMWTSFFKRAATEAKIAENGCDKTSRRHIAEVCNLKRLIHRT